MIFPVDLSYIDLGRSLEIEAVTGGRRTNEFSVSPGNPNSLDDDEVNSVAVDDIQDTEERLSKIEEYVSLANNAFRQRGMTYPFRRSRSGDSLNIIQEERNLASRCAELGELVSRGGVSAKSFEKRAADALHTLIGGWAVCLGHPREDKTGPKRAVERFRQLLRAHEKGSSGPKEYPSSGDLGADGFWILGRTWGGPIVFFQAKNTPFSIRGLPQEFLRSSDVICSWFGKNFGRRIIPIYAVNTVLTLDLKERAFHAAADSGLHIIDAVDILNVENAETLDPQQIQHF